MRKYISCAAIFAAAMTLFSACQQKMENNLPEAKLSFSPTGKIILSEDTSSDVALTVSWNSVGDGANYTLSMAAANNASDALKKETAETSVSYTGEELQQALIGFGFNPGTNASLKFTLEATKDGNTATTSANVNVVLYTHVVHLAVPVITLSSANLTLSAEDKDAEALKISWTDASVEDAYVEYNLCIAKADDAAFANPLEYATADAREKSFTNNDLQFALRGTGFNPGDEASLICRVEAYPSDGTIEAVVSETVSLAVTLYPRTLNTDIPESVTLLGDGTEFKWEMNAEAAQLTLTDAEKGIFEIDAKILSSKGTFKFFFNKNWNKGFKPGTGDYYWEDVTIPETLGDLDYFRLLIPGKYHFVCNTSEVSIQWTLLESSTEAIYVHGPAVAQEGEESGDVAISATSEQGIFSGVVTLAAGQEFVIIPDTTDSDRGYFCHPTSSSEGLSWRLAEDREKSKEYEKFKVSDSGEYKITVNVSNHTMTAEPVI